MNYKIRITSEEPSYVRLTVDGRPVKDARGRTLFNFDELDDIIRGLCRSLNLRADVKVVDPEEP